MQQDNRFYYVLYAGKEGMAAHKSIGGILHKIFDFTFGITLCGVRLFLNKFFKSVEKLIANKYNYRNQVII